jgi:hypothetical protein
VLISCELYRVTTQVAASRATLDSSVRNGLASLVESLSPNKVLVTGAKERSDIQHSQDPFSHGRSLIERAADAQAPAIASMLHFASCFPWALAGKQHVQQVVLKIYVARESLVVLTEKERIGEREEKRVVTWRDGVEGFAREQ